MYKLDKMKSKSGLIVIGILIVLLASCNLNAQVGINDDGSAPEASAVLDLKSSNKGFLPPRMIEVKRNEIINPTAGLIIYCIDCVEMQMFNGNVWTNMIGGFTTPGISAISIGEQQWMASNLNVGTMITGATNMTNNGIYEKYCYDDLEVNCDLYGAVYQWDEMMQYDSIESTQGLCPLGWHLPSNSEWATLISFLDIPNTGSKMAQNEPLWTDGNLDQSLDFGSSSFGALPGGFRSTIGLFEDQSLGAYFWVSNDSSSNGWRRGLNYTSTSVGNGIYDKSFGFSVRCIAD